jgi:hypothetical protein
MWWRRRESNPADDALHDAPVVDSRALRLVKGTTNAVERSGTQRGAAEPLQAVADPVAAALEAALALRRAGADPKALRRALRRIEERLDESPANLGRTARGRTAPRALAALERRPGAQLFERADIRMPAVEDLALADLDPASPSRP